MKTGYFVSFDASLPESNPSLASNNYKRFGLACQSSHDTTVSEEESTWSCQISPVLPWIGSQKTNGFVDKVEVGYDIISSSHA